MFFFQFDWIDIVEVFSIFSYYTYWTFKKTDAVKVEDVPKSILIKQLQKETDPIKMKEILNELHNIDTVSN